MKCPEPPATPKTPETPKTPKSILFIYNTIKNRTDNSKNQCYNNLKKEDLDCLKNIYSAILILDGPEYKQQTSRWPKFYVTDSDLPVVAISYLDQEKVPKLNSIANGARGSVLTNSIDKILDDKETFNFRCDQNKRCIRFEVLCFVKAYFVYRSVDEILLKYLFVLG